MSSYPVQGRVASHLFSLAMIFFAPLGMAGQRNDATLPMRVIIDTDAGTDDLIAIAFLLSLGDVTIDGITVCNGLAHVDRGAHNILRLLSHAGKEDIPVYLGESRPLKGNAAFPAEWRAKSDDLPGVGLSKSQRRPQNENAVDFLARALADNNTPRQLLALGPLTNIAQALARTRGVSGGFRRVVIMGGAVTVPGNLGDGGVFKTNNTTAEWNFYVDPAAAAKVFDSGLPITLVPLDACNRVPINANFIRQFEDRATSALGRFVSQVLRAERDLIDQGFYYAWDPLAAVTLVQPEVSQLKEKYIVILQKPPQDGRSEASEGRAPNASVAIDADSARFARVFTDAFSANHR